MFLFGYIDTFTSYYGVVIGLTWFKRFIRLTTIDAFATKHRDVPRMWIINAIAPQTTRKNWKQMGKYREGFNNTLDFKFFSFSFFFFFY